MNITLPLRVAVLLIAGLGLALTRCSGARSVVVDVDPTTPGRTACTRGTWRCNGLVPESCDSDEASSGVTRWWPAHGLGADLAPAPCVACTVDDGGPAHCAPSPLTDGGSR